MSKTVIYYMSPGSPWTYIGGKRLPGIAAAANAEIEIRPANFGPVFQATGGLPLHERSAARQAYRLVELARWRDHWGLEMNIEPSHFPVDGSPAARLIIAAKQAGQDAVGLSNRLMAGLWEDDLDIGDHDVLGRLADDSELMGRIDSAEVIQEYDNNTQAALDDGVFGAPWYIYLGQGYWGQDRLDLLQIALRAN